MLTQLSHNLTLPVKIEIAHDVNSVAKKTCKFQILFHELFQQFSKKQHSKKT